MEASYFYYRPSDLRWDGTGRKGHYLDKGFDIKFIYKSKYKNIPSLAVGLDDFAGTGYFTREYIVSSYDYENTRFNLGIGWGKFTGENSFKNPLSSIFEGFSSRPTTSKNVTGGGQPSYDQWFRGEASIFGGIEHKFTRIKDLKFKVEYDPFDYFDFSAANRFDALYDIRKKDSKINFGISYPINKFLTVDASFIKGNTFNLSFNLSASLNKNLVSKEKFDPIIDKHNQANTKETFYGNLLYNMNKNNLLLQTANIDKSGKLELLISTSDHRNAIRSSSYAGYIANKVAENNDIKPVSINVSHINAGMVLNEIEYLPKHLKQKENELTPIEFVKYYTKIDSGLSSKYKTHEFQPKVNFPVIFSSVSPAIVSHIGNPEKFYYGGINLSYTGEIQFSRNIFLTSKIDYPIYQSIEDSVSGPGSVMEHVRTDLVQYLKEDDLSIARLQMDYIWSPYKEIYTKISGGIFEDMFGGVGAEILYKPFNKNFNIGLEIFKVKQRAFKKRFNFQDYSTVTGHINFGYLLPLNIESNLSFGRYLAKDDGYTLDLSRRTKSGFKAGFYFTRTNVSKETFGEGSFDKGFYFQMPLDLFTNKYDGNYSTFKLSPLTRDGGARLTHDKDLRGLVYNSTLNELNSQWKGFLN